MGGVVFEVVYQFGEFVKVLCGVDGLGGNVWFVIGGFGNDGQVQCMECVGFDYGVGYVQMGEGVLCMFLQFVGGIFVECQYDDLFGCDEIVVNCIGGFGDYCGCFF